MYQGFVWLSSGNIHWEEEGPLLQFRHTFGAVQRGPPTMTIPRVWGRKQTDSLPRREGAVLGMGHASSAFPRGRSPRNTLPTRLGTSRIPSLCSGKKKICSYVPEGNGNLVATHFLTELSWSKDYITAFIYLSIVLYISNISKFIR